VFVEWLIVPFNMAKMTELVVGPTNNALKLPRTCSHIFIYHQLWTKFFFPTRDSLLYFFALFHSRNGVVPLCGPGLRAWMSVRRIIVETVCEQMKETERRYIYTGEPWLRCIDCDSFAPRAPLTHTSRWSSINHQPRGYVKSFIAPAPNVLLQRLCSLKGKL